MDFGVSEMDETLLDLKLDKELEFIEETPDDFFCLL